MVRYVFAFTVAAVAVAALGGGAMRAQDKGKTAGKDGANVAAPGSPRAKADARATSVAHLATAYELIRIGEETKSPEALVLAAKLIAAHPTDPADKDSKTKLVKGDEPAKGDAAEVTPKALLAKAAKLSPRPYVAELVKAAEGDIAELKRGNERGPQTYYRYISGNSRCVFNGVYLGGQLAAITVTTDNGAADLDIYVYDDRGNLIVRDERPSRNATVSWYPRYTGDFRIEVVNASGSGANYRYIHN